MNSNLMDIEKTWLYHEIGRCYMELGEYDQSYDYGRMSLSVAEEMKEQDWIMNASLLCAQSLGKFYIEEKISKISNLQW